MAHFSAFGDSTASHFICVRIRFGPCNNYNHYLVGFCIAGGRGQNMDPGSMDPPFWTGPMDHLYGPGPWTPIFSTQEIK